MSRLRLILKIIQVVLEVINDEMERKKRNELEESDKSFNATFRNNDRIF